VVGGLSALAEKGAVPTQTSEATAAPNGSREDAAFIRQESLFGRLPLLPSEREYGTAGAHTMCFAYAVATWCFMTGGFVAHYTGAIDGMICVIAGSVVGTFLVTMAPALASQRYGLEQIDYCRSAFGPRGTRVVLVFYVINQVGWNGLLLVMFGNALRNILRGIGYEPGTWVVGVGVTIGLWLTYLLVTRGVHLLNISNAYVGPGLAILTVFMFGMLLHEHGWHEIASAKPLDPFPDRWLNYVFVFELSLAGGIGWWAGIGFLARNTRTRRAAVYPEVLQLGLAMGLVTCIGLFSSLVMRTGDPTEWMIPIGGIWVGMLALLFVGMANVSSAAVATYTCGLALRHLHALRARPWWHLVIWSLVPCLPFVIWPGELYSYGATFLAYNGTLYAPLGGILFADFVILRRQRLNIWAIFDDHPSTEYYYSRGFNWPALVCTALGMGVYLFLLDPFTYAAHPWFRYVTASLPASVVPGAVYWAWMRPRVARAAATSDAQPEHLLQPNI
jgi:NCS1 family nucleobase:cation symporter-1